jgi:hypothetical protein
MELKGKGASPTAPVVQVRDLRVLAARLFLSGAQ